ncbi:EAP30/Vps36 family-domain-containing protein [Dissophora ornata]|nr:EAP30/Vps36 family-domain-containing protein [Dissophora ornata]
MDRWDPIQLTSTFRPILEPREAIQTTQDQVGLYDGQAEDYPNGTVYLTSYRILYIDAKDPVRKSIGMPLRLIHGIQHYGGFMSSSPKITLDLYPRPNSFDSQSSTDLLASQSATSNLNTTMGALSLKNEPSWVCAICYHSNQGGFIKCAVCGVKKPAGNIETPTTPVADPFLLNEQRQGSPVQSNPSAGNSDGSAALEQPCITCPACTFANDPFMIQCEICGAELQDAHKFLSSVSNLYSFTSSSGSYSKSVEDANSVKLSFRAGGNGTFHTLLKAAMASKAWEVSSSGGSFSRPVESSTSQPSTPQSETAPASPSVKFGGISGIMRNAETNKKATDETLSQAFQDLQGLMDKAAEMVALAESISNRLAKSNTMNNEETATFKTYLLSMGIAAPVTKDTAGAVFHKELARELVEFILPIVEREGGTMSLMDVYCVFNRARELISPKDLHTACQMFSELHLPLRLRKFDSGLLAIQTMERYSDDEVSTSIAGRIQCLPAGAGLTAVELASAIQISVALAQEQLLMTEARGLICRDESVEGLRFYDNLIAKWEI